MHLQKVLPSFSILKGDYEKGLFLEEFWSWKLSGVDLAFLQIYESCIIL